MGELYVGSDGIEGFGRHVDDKVVGNMVGLHVMGEVGSPKVIPMIPRNCCDQKPDAKVAEHLSHIGWSTFRGFEGGACLDNKAGFEPNPREELLEDLKQSLS